MANSTSNLDLVSVSQSNKEVTVNAALDAASPAMLYGRRAVTTAALTWGYYGGAVSVSGTPTQIANGTVALAASATNYVEADPATGAVSVNQTGFTAGRTPLYNVATGASTVTIYTDLRVLGGGGGVTSEDVSDAIAAHEAETDPHPQYLTQTEGDARYDAVGAASAAITAHVSASDPHTQYQKESEKGAANGYASLDGGGKLPTSQLPNLAIIDFLGTAANQTAMLALSGEKGDWCARSDNSKVYVITGSDPTLVGSWTALSYPTGTGGTVTSVDLAVPGLLYNVSGNPVTSSGTLTFSLKTQVKNTFLAGPTTGADATPTMRTLVAADMAALLAAVNVFTKNQSVTPVSLGSGVSPAIDASLTNNFKITLTANNTLVNPTNLTEGMILNFAIDQDATGGRTLSYGSLYKFPGGTVPTLSTAANAKDFMSCYYDGSILRCQFNRGFA
jgi:hypothetical protein